MEKDNGGDGQDTKRRKRKFKKEKKKKAKRKKGNKHKEKRRKVEKQNDIDDHYDSDDTLIMTEEFEPCLQLRIQNSQGPLKRSIRRDAVLFGDHTDKYCW